MMTGSPYHIAQKPGGKDWSYSFEPFPLFGVKGRAAIGLGFAASRLMGRRATIREECRCFAHSS